MSGMMLRLAGVDLLFLVGIKHPSYSTLQRKGCHPQWCHWGKCYWWHRGDPGETGLECRRGRSPWQCILYIINNFCLYLRPVTACCCAIRVKRAAGCIYTASLRGSRSTRVTQRKHLQLLNFRHGQCTNEGSVSSRYRQGWSVELTFERTGTEKTQGDIVCGCSSNSCYGRKVGRGKCPSSGICLELCKSLDFSVRWKFCQIKRKKKCFLLIKVTLLLL